MATLSFFPTFPQNPCLPLTATLRCTFLVHAAQFEAVTARRRRRRFAQRLADLTVQPARVCCGPSLRCSSRDWGDTRSVAPAAAWCNYSIFFDLFRITHSLKSTLPEAADYVWLMFFFPTSPVHLSINKPAAPLVCLFPHPIALHSKQVHAAALFVCFLRSHGPTVDQ